MKKHIILILLTISNGLPAQADWFEWGNDKLDPGERVVTGTTGAVATGFPMLLAISHGIAWTLGGVTLAVGSVGVGSYALATALGADKLGSAIGRKLHEWKVNGSRDAKVMEQAEIYIQAGDYDKARKLIGLPAR